MCLNFLFVVPLLTLLCMLNLLLPKLYLIQADSNVSIFSVDHYNRCSVSTYIPVDVH